MVALRQAPVRKDIFNLPDADALQSRFLDRVAKRPAAGRQGEVPPVAGPDKVPGSRTDEGTRDHPADAEVSLQHIPRDPAEFVQLLRREKLFMAGDLEHAVRAGIDDRGLVTHMLLAKFIQDYRAGFGTVSDDLVADGLLKRFNKGSRETVREGGKSFLHPDAGNLPVAGGRILALAALGSAAVCTGDRPVPVVSGRGNFTQANGSHVRQLRITRGDHMAQGIGPDIAVVGGVRQFTGAHCIQYGQKYKFSGKYGANLLEEVARYAMVGGTIAMERRDEFDIIHAHDWLTYMAGIAAKELTGKPLVVHAGGR